MMDTRFSSDDESALWAWFNSEMGTDIESKVCSALGVVGGNDEKPHKDDQLDRIVRGAGLAESCEALFSKLQSKENCAVILWQMFLIMSQQRFGFTAVTLAQLQVQLHEVLSTFISLPHPTQIQSLASALHQVAHVLSGRSCPSLSLLRWTLDLFGVVVVVSSDELLEKTDFSSTVFFVQMSLCVAALRHPMLVLIRPEGLITGSASLDAQSSRLRGATFRRQLEGAGQDVQKMRLLVEDKQRQYDVCQVRLQRVEQAAREEKHWLQRRLREVEEQLAMHLKGASDYEESSQQQQQQQQHHHHLEVDLEEALRVQQELQESLDGERRQVEHLQRKLSMQVQETSSLERAMVEATQRAQQAERVGKKASSVRRLGAQRWAYLPWAMLLFASACMIGAYAWSYENGHLTFDTVPFLSAAIDYPPESCFGSMFVAVIAVFIVLISGIRWRINTAKLDAFNLKALESSRTHHRINGVAFWAGFFAGIGVLGIGSFQIHNVRQAHLAFGGLFFVAINVCLIGNTIIDWRLRDKTKPALRWFRVCLIVLHGSLLLSIVPLYFIDGNDMVDDARSVLEIVMTALVFIHIMTFSSDLSGIEVLFDIRKVSKKDLSHMVTDETPLFQLDDLE